MTIEGLKDLKPECLSLLGQDGDDDDVIAFRPTAFCLLISLCNEGLTVPDSVTNIPKPVANETKHPEKEVESGCFTAVVVRPSLLI